jgi:hypothetical protein
VSTAQFRGICAEAGMTNAGEQNQFSRLLHDLGVVMCFPTIRVCKIPLLCIRNGPRMEAAGFFSPGPWAEVARTCAAAS